jgi:hypothetical protein
MEKIISTFTDKYPRVAEYILNIKKYPDDLQMRMLIGVSVLMAKMDKGDYNSYLKSGMTMGNEVIDMFGKTYLQTYCKVADEVYLMMGTYENFPKANVLIPDNFIKKLIGQAN